MTTRLTFDDLIEKKVGNVTLRFPSGLGRDITAIAKLLDEINAISNGYALFLNADLSGCLWKVTLVKSGVDKPLIEKPIKGDEGADLIIESLELIKRIIS